MNVREAFALQASNGSAPVVDADIWPWQLPGLVCATRHFSSAAFTVEDFSAEGIVRPPALQRAVAKRQAEYLAGRVCAREALHHLTGSVSSPGPQVGGAPQWPAGVCGSISHTRDEALAVVAFQRDYIGLGVDRERYLSETQVCELADSILTPTELAQLAQCTDKTLRTTLAFSLKESLFKALYPLVGCYFDFQDAEVSAWTDTGTARLQLLRDLSPGWGLGTPIPARFQAGSRGVTTLVGLPVHTMPGG
jgi:enterobactin synthetase component D